MSRLGGTGPARRPPLPRRPRPASLVPGRAGPSCSCAHPANRGTSTKRHWAASGINGAALEQTRRIACPTCAGEARGWNARIVIETSRALAVVLAGHAARRHDRLVRALAGPARRDLSVTRTAEILGPGRAPGR